MSNDKLLKAVLGNEVFEGLTKALEKLNTKSVVDIQELHAAMKTVPKAVMAFLVRELKPMELHEAKEIRLPYHPNAIMLINKHDADVYAGHISQDGKIVHEFELVSIPQLAAHLVSNYELYDKMGDMNEETTPMNEESSSSSIIRRLAEAPREFQGESTRSLVAGEGQEPKHEAPIKEGLEVNPKMSLLERQVKSLEEKIDQIMVLLSRQKSSDAVQKSESRAVLAKISKILSAKSLAKAGLMPTMPKPPGAGTKVGGNAGITQGGLHSPKSAATDLPGHNIHTGVENPYLKAPKPAPGTPKQPKQPKQPKTAGASSSFTAAKSEGTSKCKDCGDVLVKSGEYVGCSCFSALSKPTLKKSESTVTYQFGSDWDEDSRFALWKTLRK